MKTEEMGWLRRWIATQSAAAKLQSEIRSGTVDGVEIPEHNPQGLLGLHKELPGRRLSSFARGGIFTSLGAGALSGYVPWLRARAGLGSAYHGTQASNLPGLLETGFSLDHAGKAARLNSFMMRDALIDFMQSKFKGKLPRGAYQALSDVATDAPHYAKALTEETQRLIRRAGMNVSLDEINEHLTNRGRRVYFGGSPSSVMDWGQKGGDLALAAKRQSAAVRGEFMDRMKEDIKGIDLKTLKGKARVAKTIGRHAVSGPVGQIADLLTGGAISNVEDLAHYRRFLQEASQAPKMNMTRAQAMEYLSTLPDIQQRQAVLGVPTKALRDVRTFSDFPVVGHIIGPHKGAQRLVRDYGMVNYSPGRDMSVGHGVGPEGFNKLYLMRPGDHGEKSRGAIDRVINITDAKAVAPETKRKLSLLARARGSMMPLAMTYAGTHMLSKGLTGMGPYGHLKGFIQRRRQPQAPAEPENIIPFPQDQTEEERPVKAAALGEGTRRGLRYARSAGLITSPIWAPGIVGGVLTPASEDPIERAGAEFGGSVGGALGYMGGTLAALAGTGYAGYRLGWHKWPGRVANEFEDLAGRVGGFTHSDQVRQALKERRILDAIRAPEYRKVLGGVRGLGRKWIDLGKKLPRADLLRMGASAALSAGLMGYMGAAGVAGGGTAKRQARALGTAGSPILTTISGGSSRKLDDFVSENPTIAPVADSLALMGAAAGTGYAAGKYYPHTMFDAAVGRHDIPVTTVKVGPFGKTFTWKDIAPNLRRGLKAVVAAPYALFGRGRDAWNILRKPVLSPTGLALGAIPGTAAVIGATALGARAGRRVSRYYSGDTEERLNVLREEYLQGLEDKGVIDRSGLKESKGDS